MPWACCRTPAGWCLSSERSNQSYLVGLPLVPLPGNKTWANIATGSLVATGVTDTGEGEQPAEHAASVPCFVEALCGVVRATPGCTCTRFCSAMAKEMACRHARVADAHLALPLGFLQASTGASPPTFYLPPSAPSRCTRWPQHPTVPTPGKSWEGCITTPAASPPGATCTALGTCVSRTLQGRAQRWLPLSRMPCWMLEQRDAGCSAPAGLGTQV